MTLGYLDQRTILFRNVDELYTINIPAPIWLVHVKDTICTVMESRNVRLVHTLQIKL